MEHLEAYYPAVVIGGGMAGVCAAIALSRQGIKTALIHDRPVLGGNSSAEINVPFGSADNKGTCRHSRETGIIDDLLVENAIFPNPSRPEESQGFSGSIWSIVLWAEVKKAGVSLYLNTIAKDPLCEENKITAITAEQYTTEKQWLISGDIFLDCSGDGRVAFESGAIYMRGRESRSLYGESMAPEESDKHTMGNSVYIRARDVGYPVPFTRPEWAHPILSDDDLPGGVADCPHNPNLLKGHPGGYWWLEYGGMLDTISDSAAIYEELLCYAIGVWDHIKNHGEHGADNYVLDGISVISGKRESRRFVGDTILTQQDIVERRVFSDTVAYGGWNIDLHYPKGISDKYGRYWHGLDMKGRYGIPLSAMYSKNIDNLLFAGRNISATHSAFGSTRVMGTCAVMGHAIGCAAFLCLKYHQTPRYIGVHHINELQQSLLRQDAYLPGISNNDPYDLARTSLVTASSEVSLIFPLPETYMTVSTTLAQAFFAKTVQKVLLPLQNTSKGDVMATLTLKRNDVIDLFDDAYEVTKAHACVSPGISWVEFSFENTQSEETGCLQLWLETNPLLAWGYSKKEVEATNAAQEEIAGMQRLRGTFGMRIIPESACYPPSMLLSGVTRPDTQSNLWIAQDGFPQWLQLNWKNPIMFNVVHLCFNNQLDTPIRRYADNIIAPMLIKEYAIDALVGKEWVRLVYETKNRNRRRYHTFDKVKAIALKVTLFSANGSQKASMFEIRVYNETKQFT